MRERGLAQCHRGNHSPSRTYAEIVMPQGGPPVRQTRCTRCGLLLTKSPITRRWRITGMMG